MGPPLSYWSNHAGDFVNLSVPYPLMHGSMHVHDGALAHRGSMTQLSSKQGVNGVMAAV